MTREGLNLGKDIVSRCFIRDRFNTLAEGHYQTLILSTRLLHLSMVAIVVSEYKREEIVLTRNNTVLVNNLSNLVD